VIAASLAGVDDRFALRRAWVPAVFNASPALLALALFVFGSLRTSSARAEDLTVSGPVTISSPATYDNVTVMGTGVLTLNAILTVNANMTIATGGVVLAVVPRDVIGL
jgi:hypothetical protein